MDRKPSIRKGSEILHNENAKSVNNKNTLPELLEVQKQEIINMMRKNFELARQIENREALKSLIDEFQKQTNINLNRPSLTKRTIRDLLDAQISENIEKAQNASVLIGLFDLKSNDIISRNVKYNRNLPSTTNRNYNEQLQRDEEEIRRLLRQTTLSEEDEKKIEEMTAIYDKQRSELTQKFKRLKYEYVNKMSLLHLDNANNDKKTE